MKKIYVSNHLRRKKLEEKTDGMGPVRSGAAVLLLTGLSYRAFLKRT